MHSESAASVVKVAAALTISGYYHKGCRHILKWKHGMLNYWAKFIYIAISEWNVFSSQTVLSRSQRYFSRLHSSPQLSFLSSNMSVCGTPGQKARGNRHWWVNEKPFCSTPSLLLDSKDEHHFCRITIKTREKNVCFPATGSRDWGNN